MTRAVEWTCEGRPECTEGLEQIRAVVRGCVAGRFDAGKYLLGAVNLMADTSGRSRANRVAGLLDDVALPRPEALEGPLRDRLLGEVARLCLARVADLGEAETSILEDHAEKGSQPVDWAQACADAHCDDELAEIVRMLPEVP